MGHYVYILLSNDKKHWYIGSTSDIHKRLREHNSGQTRSIKPFRPFSLVCQESFESRSLARRRELYLKSSKGWLEYKKIKESIILNLS